LLEIDNDVSELVARHGHGEFAARQKFRRLARYCDEIWFGERVHEANLLERVQHTLQIVRAGRGRGPDISQLKAGACGERLTQQTIGIGRGRDNGHARRTDGGLKIDAELLGDIALDFGDPDFEKHLFARFDPEHVQDFLRVVDHAGGEILGTRGIHRICDRAGEHDVVVQRRNVNIGIGYIEMHHRGEIGDIALDMDVDRQNLMTCRVEEKCVGLTGLHAKQKHAARRADHGIDDRGVRDHDVARIAVELHDRRFVETERDVLDGRTIAARGHRNDAGIVPFAVCVGRDRAGFRLACEHSQREYPDCKKAHDAIPSVRRQRAQRRSG